MPNKKIIVGNWKMNPTGPSDAKHIFSKIVSTASRFKKVETVICPPSIFLPILGNNKSVKIGAQDAFYESSGPFTGFISSAMVKSFQTEYLLVGHSERRRLGETDELISKKIKAGLKQRLKIILCIGEEQSDENGIYLKLLRQQLLSGLGDIPKKYFDQIIIAHEPVWAIGSFAKEVDTPERFQHNRLFIKKVLADLAGKKFGVSVPVLYGGSVGPKNAQGFLETGEADGLLVGRSSLIPVDFVKILEIANACS